MISIPPVTSYNLKDVIRQFQLEGSVLEIAPHPSGHINDTFLITIKGIEIKHYIVQLINKHVFKQPEQVMENVQKITEHLRKKITAEGGNPARECLTLVATIDDAYYYVDNNGNYWRVYLCIENTKTYDLVDSAKKSFEGGKAFGKFQALLVDLPGGPLHETIPNFHNIEKRLAAFWKVVEQDSSGRAAEVPEEIRFVEKRQAEMEIILNKGREGKIPERITHNDTKFNNVLIDEHERGICVIDLDTVMQGYIHYDFGDAIRTVTNTGEEDEEDLSKVNVNLTFFSEYTRGYMEYCRSFITDEELRYLAFSSRLMTFMLGVRFLTDHIDGDNYFKIHFPYHNLQRTRAQFKLVQSMEEQSEAMEEIVQKEFKKQ